MPGGFPQETREGNRTLVTPFLALAKRGEAGGELAMERGRRWRLVLDGSELRLGEETCEGMGMERCGRREAWRLL
jgi:hypothetical protein